MELAFDKIRAHARAEVALMRRQGKLFDGPCEVCSSPYTHAHHEDYAKPLEIRWLCGSHHTRYHAKLRAGKVQSLDQYVAETRENPQEASAPPKQVETLIQELRTWTKNTRGGTGQIARELGVERQTVANWISGHRTPMLKHWLSLQAFMEKKKS